MEEKQQAKNNIRPVRWQENEWLWLADVAKSVGLSRSEFVRRSTMEAAKAAMVFSPAYSVCGAPATQQNTPTNHFDRSIAKQGSGRNGGEGSRTKLDPKGITWTNPEDLGRKGGGVRQTERRLRPTRPSLRVAEEDDFAAIL